MNNKVDVLGRPLSIGDHVVYTGSKKGLHMGIITRFTKQLVFVNSCIREFPSGLLLITESEAKRFKKHLKNG